MKKILLLISSVVALLLVTSCSPEYIKAVRDFHRNNHSLSVMIMRPQNIYYSNYKIYEDMKDMDTMNISKKDDLLKEKSDFLSKLDDDKINILFVDNIIKELCKTNINVYTYEYESDFLKNNFDSRFVVDIKQLEFDEYYDKVNDEYFDVKFNGYTYDTILYTKDVYLNAFSVNMWLDYFTPYVDTSTFLFASNNITSYHLGYFGKDFYDTVVYYEDNIDLTYEDVEQFIQIIAKKYAEYIYDRILNDYLNINHSELLTYPDKYILHYGINDGCITLINKSKCFIPVDKKN